MLTIEKTRKKSSVLGFTLIGVSVRIGKRLWLPLKKKKMQFVTRTRVPKGLGKLDIFSKGVFRYSTLSFEIPISI